MNRAGLVGIGVVVAVIVGAVLVVGYRGPPDMREPAATMASAGGDARSKGAQGSQAGAPDLAPPAPEQPADRKASDATLAEGKAPPMPVQAPDRTAPAAQGAPRPAAKAAAAAFHPPAEDAMPSGELGDVIRKGREIFTDTPKAAAGFVGNSLRCSSCHLDAGRLPDSAPLWAAFVAYPAYRSKTKEVNTYEQRLQGCFEYSMNGKAPPAGDPLLVALQTYSYWLASGAPVDPKLPGRGYPKLAKPGQPPDFTRGAKVYEQRCALCHGADGAGQYTPQGHAVFPALWGPDSFNWGAGMGRISNAAAFVHANMPLGLGGTLSEQEAWDVALFMDSHERPQDPRYTKSVAETRKRFHDTDDSMYGREVGGKVLGDSGPPKRKLASSSRAGQAQAR